MQIKREKTASPYHRIDPAILWFINTKGCRRYLALACFMSEIRGEQSSDCCDNCIYDQWDDTLSEIPTFNHYDMMACHCRQYLFTQEYKRSIIETERRNLMMREGEHIKKTSAAQQERCKLALDEICPLQMERWNG